MSKSLKNFGKKVLVFGGLIAVLTAGGCKYKDEVRMFQTFIDINKDGIEDLVYVREFYPGYHVSKFIPSYEIMIAEGKGKRIFKEAKSIIKFGKNEKPIEMRIKDVNNDENFDIIYLKEFYPRKVPGSFLGANVPDYELRVAYGNGNGTFKEPKTIKSFGQRKPVWWD